VTERLVREDRAPRRDPSRVPALVAHAGLDASVGGEEGALGDPSLGPSLDHLEPKGLAAAHAVLVGHAFDPREEDLLHVGEDALGSKGERPIGAVLDVDLEVGVERDHEAGLPRGRERDDAEGAFVLLHDGVELGLTRRPSRRDVLAEHEVRLGRVGREELGRREVVEERLRRGLLARAARGAEEGDEGEGAVHEGSFRPGPTSAIAEGASTRQAKIPTDAVRPIEERTGCALSASKLKPSSVDTAASTMARSEASRCASSMRSAWTRKSP